MYQREKIKVALWICLFLLTYWLSVQGFNKLTEFELTPENKQVIDSLNSVIPVDSKYTLVEKKANVDFAEKILIPHIVKWEGGYSNQKHDAGGETMGGITFGTYNSLCEAIYGIKPSKEHFMTLTSKDTEVFIKKFESLYHTDRINHFKIKTVLTELYWGGNRAMLRLNDEIFKQYGKKFKFNSNNLNRLENDFIVWVNTLSVEEQNKFAHFILSSFIFCINWS